MRAAYTGHEALTFGDYLDLETGKTLRAEPGVTYDIAPASGRLVDEVPLQWFTPVDAEAWAAAQAERLAADSGEEPSAGEDAPPGDEAAAADPGTEEGQQF